MGFKDLLSGLSSKKVVNLNDDRYKASEKLKNNGQQTVRAPFSLYGTDFSKETISEISEAYEKSDKKIPMGELLNKMVDLIVDMEDGKLDSASNAVSALKFSVILTIIYEDKKKRKADLNMFDNSLKFSVINSKTFQERYPGKYTNQTSFTDKKVKQQFVQDIYDTFKDVTVPVIEDAAKEQSANSANTHNNKTLDVIVHWAVENYQCKVESFFEKDIDPETHLPFSINTIILHLKNGYDLSIVGYTGTDHDDKFTTSIFNTNSIDITACQHSASKNDLQALLDTVSASTPIDPMNNFLKSEKQKHETLQEQYNILINTKPMVKEEILNLKAAENVVGKDYIWGCKKFRETHEDLPSDFKLEDLALPSLAVDMTNAIPEVKIGSVEEDDGITALNMFGEPLPSAPKKKKQVPLLFKEVEEKDEQSQKVDEALQESTVTEKMVGVTPQLSGEKDDGMSLEDVYSVLLPNGQAVSDEVVQYTEAPSVTAAAKEAPLTESNVVWKEQVEKEEIPENKKEDTNTNESLIPPDLTLDSLFQ